MLIKIDRSSIKKNPNAGNTRTAVKGPREVKFTYKGKLPECFKDGENCIISRWNPNEFYEGYMDDESLFPKELFEDKNLTVEIDNNLHFYDHLPEPDYLYEYENPAVKCAECGNEIPLDDIEHDYDDEGNSYSKCPKCHAIESFDIEYEKLNTVLNENN